MFETLRPFLISFAIGLIIGIERERAHPAGSRAMGVRTFALIALLGTFAHELQSPVLLALIGAFVFGLIVYGFYQSGVNQPNHPRRGITTELAAGVVFCLGYLSAFNTLLTLVVGLTVLIILFGRKSLHEFAREDIRPKEIQATIIILVMTLIVLSFLPDRTIDPWNLFNPRRFGMIIILVSLVQFTGYVAVRLFGQNFGMGLVGFFGGIASSTAVFATLPVMSRENPHLTRPLIIAGILAQIGTMCVLLVILTLMAPAIFQKLVWPILAMNLMGLGIAFFLTNGKQPVNLLTPPKNPLDLRAVIRLSLFIAGMLILAALAQRYFSSRGVGIVTFLGALFELHGVSIANAALFSSGKLNLANAAQNQFFAIAATFFTKYVLLAFLGRNRFAVLSAISLTLMLIAGFITADLLGIFSTLSSKIA